MLCFLMDRGFFGDVGSCKVQDKRRRALGYVDGGYRSTGFWMKIVIGKR